MITKIITGQGHIWIEFENGLTLSIFNGFGSYTENHYKHEEQMKMLDNRDIYFTWESKEIEVAVFITDGGGFKTKEVLDSNDSVLGNVDVSLLPKIIETVERYKER